MERRDVGSQRRDVGFNHLLEHRDVSCFPLWNVVTLHSHVAELAMFKATNTHILSLPLFPPCLNPIAPFVVPIVVPTGIHSHRRPLFFPPTTSPILLPPFLHYHSTVPVSLLPHPALVSLTRIGLGHSY